MASPVLQIDPLPFMWPVMDPFLFCVHHDDAYPEGNERMGPEASLAGRNLGMDFELRDGWRMYHGRVVPGFPRHPHRGFETLTLVRNGFIDHSDSMGATARFGEGDFQWLTAGDGIQHSEMFPLVHRDRGNRVELFQIWMNLPAASKRVTPHFTMYWGEQIPRHRFESGAAATEVVTVVGALDERPLPVPPPHSWARDPDHHVAVWTLRMDPGARWTLPAGVAGLNRGLYFFEGGTMRIGGQEVSEGVGVRLRSDLPAELVNGDRPAQLLFLQGRPIGEPVARHGPFVMNTRQELHQAYVDYQRTQFGGWPWSDNDPVHPRDRGRFALHPDGRVDEPGKG